VTRYVEERRDTFGGEPICRTLGVPVSTTRADPGSHRRASAPTASCWSEIEAARSGRRRVYGARKTWKELRRRDVDVGRDKEERACATASHGCPGSLFALAIDRFRVTINERDEC